MAYIKLNDEMIAKMIPMLQAGNYAVVVCQAVGISEPTYYDYIKRGEAGLKAGETPGDNLFVKFITSIKEAESVAEMRNVNNIQRASQDTWQASAWFLERKHYKRWGAKQQVEVTGKDGGAIETDTARERIERKLNKLANTAGIPESNE